jgi:hypothetical protein
MMSKKNYLWTILRIIKVDEDFEIILVTYLSPVLKAEFKSLPDRNGHIKDHFSKATFYRLHADFIEFRFENLATILCFSQLGSIKNFLPSLIPSNPKIA